MSRVTVGDYVRLISAEEYKTGEMESWNPNMFNQNNMDILKKYGNNVYVVEDIRWDGKVILAVSDQRQDHDIGNFAFPDCMLAIWHKEDFDKEILTTDFEDILGAAE